MYTNDDASSQSREALLVKHASLVKRIAYHLIARLPHTVDVDDLIQAGMIGLLDASQQYNASQGASFETYAGIRIRGSMLDEIRRNDWAPRSVHRKAREISAVMHEIEKQQGRTHQMYHRRDQKRLPSVHPFYPFHMQELQQLVH